MREEEKVELAIKRDRNEKKLHILWVSPER